MPNFSAEIRECRIVPDIVGIVALAKLNGKRVSVTVETYRKNRSQAQSNYYFGVIVKILGEELGYTKKEMDAAICVEHLSSLDEKTGLLRIRSTKDLNTAEFEEFTSKVREWAAQLPQRIFIPLPNEPIC